MSATLTLGRRAVTEGLRTPEALFPTLFIPLFFLLVNVGQAGRVFPAEATAFLHGQTYLAFQLPNSLLMAASFGSAALFLVEEIEGGYFDKLRATPIPRSSIVLGRLYAELVKSSVIVALIVAVSMLFGVRVASGPAGFVVLVALVALWGVVYAGFMQLVALKSRSGAATQSIGMVFFPLLFLTPNFVPRDQLTRPMELLATWNPVTYVLEAARSPILDGFDAAIVARGFGVLLVAAAVMLWLNVRSINSYD